MKTGKFDLFTCPQCGGHYFGRDTELENGVQRAKAALAKKGSSSPIAEPSALKSAAARIDKDEIFTSDDHYSAFLKARKAGLVTEDDFLGPRHEEGFVTNSGHFVNREVGYALAKKALQLREDHADEFEANKEKPWLDAYDLKPYAGMQRAKAALEKAGQFSQPVEPAKGTITFQTKDGRKYSTVGTKEDFEKSKLEAENLGGSVAFKPSRKAKNSFSPVQPETISRAAVRVDKEHAYFVGRPLVTSATDLARKVE